MNHNPLKRIQNPMCSRILYFAVYFFYNIDCAFLNDDICKYLLDTSIVHQEHFNIATDIKKTKWLSAADVDACLLPAVCYDSIIIAYDKID